MNHLKGAEAVSIERAHRAKVRSEMTVTDPFGRRTLPSEEDVSTEIERRVELQYPTPVNFAIPQWMLEM